MVRFLGRHGITLLIFAFSVIYTFAARRYGIQIRPQPQSGFVPFLLGVLMIGMTGFVLVRVFLQKASAEDREESGEIPRGKFISFLFILLASAACFELLGFFLTSTAMIFLTALLMGLRGWWKALLLAVLSTLAADFLFVALLGVPLPGAASAWFRGGD